MKDEKSTGLYQKYIVKKIKNPDKEMDCIVLEFDDPIARRAITFWANLMHEDGYTLCAAQTKQKVIRYSKTYE